MTRANPLDDLDDFAPKTTPAKPVERAQIDQLAETAGFPSRQPVTTRTPVPAAPSVVPVTPRRRLGRGKPTGRVHQINIKTTLETVEELYTIADEMREPLGEILTLALRALQRERKGPGSA